MKRLMILATVLGGCAGTFGGGAPVSRSERITDSSRVTATTIIPDDPENRAVVQHLALAEEIYGKTLDALRDRRNSLRSRRRTLTLGSYATFAATTLVIGAAAISKGANDQMATATNLRTAGYGALGGLGVGTTLEVVNLMQEDPSNVEAKIRYLQSSYDNMIDRLHELFDERDNERPAPAEGTPAAKASARSITAQASPIIEAFINDALQINVKG